MKNVFACLVHESQECIVDLVRNLSHLDPSSTILLYNGGPNPDLLARNFAVNGSQPVVHPKPQRLSWGALHGFAFDCMRYALAEFDFDTITIVDSDQLLLQRGYSEALGAALAGRGGVGMLGNAPGPQPPTTPIPPAVVAWRERELWLPFLRRFPDGESKFPHWTFWPSTVFTEEACRSLVELHDTDKELATLMGASRLWATEEVVLPTLVALLGFEVAASPFSYEFVRYGVLYTPRQLGLGMQRPGVFWAHPVPRGYAHPLRRAVRTRHDQYAHVTNGGGMTDHPPSERSLLLTVPILERMRRVEGWLTDDEADLLIAGLARAVAELDNTHAVVEVGSYCGRSTLVLGSVVRAQAPASRVYAIDPHEGEVGALDQGLVRTAPTLGKFNRTIAAAELEDVVELIQQRSYETAWDRPICFLLIDGLHDYPNVSRDLQHFEPWLADGAYVAFHDYADYYPGVKTFVDELLGAGRYEPVHCAGSMMLLRRSAAHTQPVATPLSVSEPEQVETEASLAEGVAPARAASAPVLSCVMPTYNRPRLAAAAAERFLRQEDVDAELIVVDDGPESLATYLPSDPRIRHVRLERRQSIGTKRNIGYEAACGELLANWDDDDWYAPWRLAYQAKSLTQSGADVCGLNTLLYLEPAKARAWRYAWPGGARPWVHDAVLAFTRKFWLRNPFPETSMGIDCAFLWTPTRKRIVALADERFYVGVIHGRNTSPKNTSTGVWHPYSLADVEELLGEEAAFFREAFSSPAGIAV